MRLLLGLCFLAGTPALSGCFLLPSGEGSRVRSVPDELRRPRLVVPLVSDFHSYGDPASVKVGQWVKVREGDRIVTVSIVEKDGEAVWFEVIDEGEPRQASARLVSVDGEVIRAFYCEISKPDEHSTVEPQELSQGAAPPMSDRTKVSEKRDGATVTVAGKELEAKRIKITYEDLEGRLTTDVSLWHSDVPPVYAGSDAGGLVRRQAGDDDVELLDFGTDATPIVPVIVPVKAEAP